MEFNVGDKLGHFEIVRMIKSGGFGAVYEARDLRSLQQIALKILHSEHASPSVIKRFEYEAQVLTELHHPNIVRMLEFGNFSPKMPYIAMELLVGRDLRAELEREGRMSVEQLVTVIEPLCRALVAVHARGIIHRDLKASNVFVAREQQGQRIVLLDFGVAKILKASALTRVGQFLGTLPYLAPEQVRGAQVDRRTDVYGLGTLMFTLLTGRPPYAQIKDIAMYLEAVTRPPRASMFVQVPRALDVVVARAMSQDPSSRYTNAMEVLDAVYGAVGMAPARPLPRVDINSTIELQISDITQLEDELMDQTVIDRWEEPSVDPVVPPAASKPAPRPAASKPAPRPAASKPAPPPVDEELDDPNAPDDLSETIDMRVELLNLYDTTNIEPKS